MIQSDYELKKYIFEIFYKSIYPVILVMISSKLEKFNYNCKFLCNFCKEHFAPTFELTQIQLHPRFKINRQLKDNRLTSCKIP